VEMWPGIHALEVSSIVNVYLLTAGPLTLVDAGMPGSLPLLRQALERMGVRIEEVRRLVLTHADIDHRGGAAAFARVSGAEVWAHEDEAAVISGQARSPGPWARKIVAATRGRHVAPLKVDRLLREGDDLDGYVVRCLPGHTPGHLGLQRGRALIGGDAVVGGRRPHPSTELLTWNPALARDSLSRITTLDVDMLLPGHGTPFNDASRRCAVMIAEKSKRRL